MFAEADPAGLAAALERLAGDAGAARAAWARSARERVVERYSWDAHCAQLEAVLLGWRRAGGMKIVARQRGLPAARRRRRLVHARPGARPCARPATRSRVLTTSPGPEDLDGLRVRRLRCAGRKRLRVPRAFARALRASRTATWSTPSTRSRRWARWPATRPARVAVTVRDHWPVCFWSTRISRGALCPAVRARQHDRAAWRGACPAPGPAGLGAPSPTCAATCALKRRALRRAGATLAVSEAIAAELRAAGLPRVEVLPNMVDAGGGAGLAAGAARAFAAARALPAVRRQARGEQGRAPAGAGRGRGAAPACPWWCWARARCAHALQVRGRRRAGSSCSCAAGPTATTCCAPWPARRRSSSPRCGPSRSRACCSRRWPWARRWRPWTPAARARSWGRTERPAWSDDAAGLARRGGPAVRRRRPARATRRSGARARGPGLLARGAHAPLRGRLPEAGS